MGCGDIESAIGVEGYYTPTRGIGGIVKKQPEDFIVSEILEGGLDAKALWFKDPLPVEPTRYTLWILKKRDIETVSAIAELAQTIGTRPSRAKICGIKDRRAVTYQYVALPVARFVEDRGHYASSRWEAWRIGFIDGLNSSRLVANKFDIIIRAAEADSSLLTHFKETVLDSGVPNFFGYQRFGLLRPITHIVGRLIVKGDLRGAVDTFLGFTTEFEPEPVRTARLAFSETGDYGEALKNFPLSLTYERRMLRRLSRLPGDYSGALRSLPLRIRRLFIDAFSSYLFNRALSLTLRDGLHLNEPCIGDLFVRIDRHHRPYGRPLQVTSANLEEVGVRLRRGEVAIVLPTPGYLSWIPRGPRGDALKNVLDQEGVSPRSFRTRLMPEVSSTGMYRPILLRPLSLELERLQDSNIRLYLTLPPSSYATSLLRELMKRSCALAYIGKEHCYA